MNTDSEVAATGTAVTHISEADDRYNLIGLDIVNNTTGETETFISLTRDEIDMPGYVEHNEKQYNDTQWHPVRVWRTTTRPGTSINIDLTPNTD